MTTSVTIKNNGKHRVNVNEIEPVGPRFAETQRTVNSHTLGVGEEVTINIWGEQHYLAILETNDVDTPPETLRAAGVEI